MFTICISFCRHSIMIFELMHSFLEIHVFNLTIVLKHSSTCSSALVCHIRRSDIISAVRLNIIDFIGVGVPKIDYDQKICSNNSVNYQLAICLGGLLFYLNRFRSINFVASTLYWTLSVYKSKPRKWYHNNVKIEFDWIHLVTVWCN